MTPISADQRPRRRRELRRGGILAGVGVLAVLALAACGSSSTPTPTAAPTSAASAATRPSGSGGVPGPAAYGVAAAISGTSIEVQDPATGQVTVTYSDATTWTQSVPATIAALAAGDCVTVTGTAPASAAPASTAPASTGNPSKTTRPTSFTATAITVIDTTNGTCAATGFGAGNRNQNGNGNRSSTGASNSPTDTPRTRTGTGGPGFAFATGTVQSVSGATIVIDTVARGAQTATTDTVTTTSTTTVTTTGPATSAALTVGECVSANGATSPNGSVSATRIALSTAGPSGCTIGFGRRGATGNGSPSA